MTTRLDAVWALGELRSCLRPPPFLSASRHEMLHQLKSLKPSGAARVPQSADRAQQLEQLLLEADVLAKLDIVYGRFSDLVFDCYLALLELVDCNLRWARPELTHCLLNLIDFEYFLYHYSYPVMGFVDLEHFPYRDHLLHIAQTGSLGSWLKRNWWTPHMQIGAEIQRQYKNSQLAQSFCEDYGVAVQDLDWDAVIDNTWWLAATLHDMGWPFVYFRQILDKTRDFYPSVFRSLSDPPLAAFAFDHHRVIDRFRTFRMDDISQSDLEHMELGKWHGLLAALELALLNFKLTEQINDKILRTQAGLACRLAAEASATHDQVGKRVDFRQDPLAFMLRLCDALQDWERIVQLCRISASDKMLREVLSVVICPYAEIDPQHTRFEFQLIYDMQPIQEYGLGPLGWDEVIHQIVTEKLEHLDELRYYGEPLDYSPNTPESGVAEVEQTGRLTIKIGFRG